MTTESPARPGRIDTDALRRRYAEERDKRLRPDGNDQYLRLTGEFAHYLDDPYTPWTERAPRTDHRTVVCIGGGFAGLVTATRLREADVDVRIIEKLPTAITPHAALPGTPWPPSPLGARSSGWPCSPRTRGSSACMTTCCSTPKSRG